jgi:hypothetical protein
MTANIAQDFADLMTRAAYGAPSGRDAAACEARALAAQKVACHLTQTGYWGGPPPTREEAVKQAARAWGDDVPVEVATALEIIA